MEEVIPLTKPSSRHTSRPQNYRGREESQSLNNGSHAHVAEYEEDLNNQDFSFKISTEKRNVKSFSVRSNLDFFADSGATSHMSDQQQFFDTLFSTLNFLMNLV